MPTCILIMKAEIISSNVIRLTGACPTRAIVQLLEPYSQGSLRWHVPTRVVASLPANLVPETLISLADRAPLPYDRPIEVDPHMWDALFPYQKEGVQRIIHQFKGRCLLADEMGLGKTFQAITCIKHYSIPTLVVCPAFLVTNWKRTLEQWQVEATVVSYGKVDQVASVVDMVVVDEAHYLKSREAQRTNAILPRILTARRALLLSGTPCPNRPDELFTLMHSLRPHIITDFTSFATRYCKPRRTQFSAFDTRGSDRPEELKWLLSRAFQVRRTKKDVLPQLPEKLQGVLYVDTDVSSRQEIASLRLKLDHALSKGNTIAQTLMMEMYRATAYAKAHNAASLIAARIQPGSVVFAHHKVVLDAVQQTLPVGIRAGRIDGSTSLPQRQRVVDGMQSGQLDVALLSMGAAGVGLTLTHACVAYFVEIPWCPAVLRQCEDRIHRIGQACVCTMYYMIAEETLDSYVWRTIHRKESVAARIGQA